MRVKPEKPKTRRLVVLMYPADHKRLEKQAQRAKISVGEFARRAIAAQMTIFASSEVGENGN